MKVLILNETGYQTFPIVAGMVEVNENDLQEIGKTKIFDLAAKKIIAKPQPTIEEIKAELRGQRETECFSIVNRGQVWYNTLTPQQIAELQSWYNAWLNVTETMQVPVKPIWLNSAYTTQNTYDNMHTSNTNNANNSNWL